MVNNLPNNQTTPSAKRFECNEQVQWTMMLTIACIEKKRKEEKSFHALLQSHPERALPQVKDLLTCSAFIQSQTSQLSWYLCAQATEYINECLFLSPFPSLFRTVSLPLNIRTIDRHSLCTRQGVHLQ